MLEKDPEEVKKNRVDYLKNRKETIRLNTIKNQTQEQLDKYVEILRFHGYKVMRNKFP